MEQQSGFGWLLVVVGLVLAAAGLVWVFLPSLPGPGHLPGDVRIERDNVRVYFPVVTCLVLSLLLSLGLWLFRSFTGR